MKKSIFTLCLFLVSFIIAGVVYAQPRQPWQQPPVDSAAVKARMDSVQAFFDKMNSSIEGKQDSPAVSVFQNIQLFKTATAGRLLGQMRNWTRILGVNCTHCHIAGQWEKDDLPPKLTARAMDKLEDDVNDLLKNIKSIKDEAHVNCFTCHRGQPKPEGSGPRGGPGGQRRRGGQ